VPWASSAPVPPLKRPRAVSSRLSHNHLIFLPPKTSLHRTMAALYPAPAAIGVFPQFIAQQPETIVLKEHVMSLTGDSFSIKKANGEPILQVEGKVFSLGGRKKVRDMAGNHLFDIKKELMHIHTTFAIERPGGEKIMEVKSSFQRKSGGSSSSFSPSWHWVWGRCEGLVVAAVRWGSVALSSDRNF